MRRNKLRELLQADTPSMGTAIQLPSPSIIEMIGHTGVYDYVEFQAEYAAYDLHDLDNMGRAVELFDMSSMIKIDQEPRRFVAQRAIGSGFQSVLFADVRSVEDALECVRAVRPDTREDGGWHGAASRRVAYMEYAGGPEYAQALRDIVVVLMIEKEAAVEALEQVLSVAGIDMIQWGGTDYSLSIGRPGAWNTPGVRAVERRVIETALKMAIPARAEITSVDELKYYTELGVRHFSIGQDLSILYGWLKGHGDQMRMILSDL